MNTKIKQKNSGITLIALIITIIVMLILAGIGISITTAVIDKATYSVFVTEMKNIEEAVNMHILERNMETANGENSGAIFETELTQEDLNSPDFPIELKQEILYVRAKLANSEITTIPSDYNAVDLTTADLFFVDSSVAEGKEKAYVYDEQSKSIFKAKPTIISGKAMFGYDYGKIIGVQGLLAQPVTPTLPEQTSGWTGSVNAPKIGTSGLIPVTINETTGEVTEVAENTAGWYEYKVQTNATPSGGDSHWANAITKNSDGQITGMFVWIPRFAYKITSGFNTSTAGIIDVVFLKEKTDKYEVDGVEYTAKRLSQANVDTNQDYYVVHPCFTKTVVNGENTYEQGEWDEELEGIWVAKFEAGYAGGNRNDGNGNMVEIRNSDITYGTNCRTNYYGNTTANSTLIPYPVFLPKTYSFNYITIGDMFRISQKIADGNTYYNLSGVDSHMMKNSEWGAVAYLAQSQYGRNGTEIAINNINKNNSPSTIHIVTGYSQGNTTADETSISSSYEWTTNLGKLASTTGNVYGIYDMSGGNHEYVTGFINNSNGTNVRTNYGTGLTQLEKDKYREIFRINNIDNDVNNWLENSTKRGDAIYETSKTTEGTGNDSWNKDFSYFIFGTYPFLIRGGRYSAKLNAGIFAFGRNNGSADNIYGWRICLAF